MGGLRNQDEWRPHLDEAVLAALDQWLKPTGQVLELKEWFGDGKSGEPVGRVARTYEDNSTSQAVIKFFGADAHPRISNVEKAWRVSRDFRRHLAELDGRTDDLDGWRAVFMVLAGDSLHRVKQLSVLSGEPEFPALCGSITGSIVHDWNDNESRQGSPRTVGVLLEKLLERRRTGVNDWMTARGADISGSEGPISSDLKFGYLTNPFSLVTGRHSALPISQLITGKAHGDLNGRNILVPQAGSAAEVSYHLIDYDRFDTEAPLARDPMHLLVALALEERKKLNDPKLWPALAEVLVDPESGEAKSYHENLRQVSSAVHKSTAPRSGTGLVDQWNEQCLIALTGAGLLHLGRNIDQDAKEWCLYLAAYAADTYVRKFGKTASTPEAHVARTDAVEDARAKHQLVDRHEDLLGLRTRLTNGPWGVTMLNGSRGIGKTKLVHAALDAVEAGVRTPQRPRVHRHVVDMAGKLDAKTLVDYLQDNPPEHEPTDGSALVRLQVTLKSLGDVPVVIAVDSAENLLDPATGLLTDPYLDEALEILATEDDHRVTVLLVSSDRMVSPGKGTWPAAEESIGLPKFRSPDLRQYMKSIDHNGTCDPDELPEDVWNELYRKLQGNPRLARLASVIVSTGEAGLDLRSLTSRLQKLKNRDVHDFLTRMLFSGLSEVSKQVIRALAAFGTPVQASAVIGLVPERAPAQVTRVLEVLAKHGVIDKVGKDKYGVPPQDARLILEPVSDATRSLYFLAATQLTELHHPDPRSVKDLRVHFAELDALLNAGHHSTAYEMIELTHDILKRWNCAHLLLDQRELVKGKLQNKLYEMSNHNALGHIYLWLDDSRAADEYLTALRLADGLGRHEDSIKIYVNLAEMYWVRDNIHDAIRHFERAQELAVELDQPMALMGALEGVAKCLRRRGHHELAAETVEPALSLPEHPRFPDTPRAQTFAVTRRVAISLWLARCYGELGRADEAELMINAALAITTERPNDWLLASCLDGQADLLFDRERFDEAEQVAMRAVALAENVHNETVLLQARTTLAMICLRLSKPEEAWSEIDSVQRLRRKHRSLLALALHALAAHQRENVTAPDCFQRLFDESTARTTTDADDFAAWNLRGLAICGLHLHRSGSLEEAVASFRRGRALTPPSAVLAGRIRFLVAQLNEAEKLKPALEVLD
ncbi:tetratricopeptide repeat protein [Lentzea sp. BCCO 10_0061]|uniref:Tetratricopeptide repeat protein n=1 Tax=Lentzea sokolovensis TaxID=3095429 RepID=A0ABU4V216_9PSEU|nr:tetratricopeptide repeat protein [Lentzea sp. BCCO 10_0061]MDX8145006.1 tetratricopeptide repeat protein [Lentzea sp. BCCO 10_0061]